MTAKEVIKLLLDIPLETEVEIVFTCYDCGRGYEEHYPIKGLDLDNLDEGVVTFEY